MLQRGLSFPAFDIDLEQLINLYRIIAPARRQPLLHKIRLFADETDVEHGWNYQQRSGNANGWK